MPNFWRTLFPSKPKYTPGQIYRFTRNKGKYKGCIAIVQDTSLEKLITIQVKIYKPVKLHSWTLQPIGTKWISKDVLEPIDDDY